MTRPRIWRIVAMDMVLLLSLALLIVIVILLMFFSDPLEAESEEPLIEPQGTLIIEMSWPPECEADIDLWVRAPSGAVVGFPRKDSDEMNLLRDDLGHSRDPSPMNAETVLSRQLTPGEWIVNVHLYSQKGCKAPIAVDVAVKKREPRDDTNSAVRNITTQSIMLRQNFEERTAVRFSLDDLGLLVPGSISQRCTLIMKPLTEGQRC